MGGISQSSQVKSLCRISNKQLLAMYMPTCETFDENLGKLKIYRKKQFNYDYLMFTSKIVQEQFMDHLASMVKVGTQSSQNIKNPRIIIQGSDKWLKIHSAEITKLSDNNRKYVNLEICAQYLNYNLKEYLLKPHQNLITPIYSNQPPPQVSYILSSIIDSYTLLKQFYLSSPQVSFHSLITSITTPGLIFINVEGCIKFLTVPLFSFADYTTKVDKCLEKCLEQQQNYSVVVTHFGDRFNGRLEDHQKMDRLFLNKFKKLIKYMKKQIVQQSSKSSGSNTETAKSQNIKNYHHISLNQKNSPIFKEHKYWMILQTFQTVQQYIQFLNGTSNLCTHIEFSPPQQPKFRHPSALQKIQKMKLDKKGLTQQSYQEKKPVKKQRIKMESEYSDYHKFQFYPLIQSHHSSHQKHRNQRTSAQILRDNCRQIEDKAKRSKKVQNPSWKIPGSNSHQQFNYRM